MTRCGALLAAAALVVSAAPGVPAVSPGASAYPVPASARHRLARQNLPTLPTESTCQQIYGIDCYTPTQIRTAYGADELDADQLTGAGRTIAVLVPFGSPTVAADLSEFDRTFGLPDPPSVRTITPAGELPSFDPANPDMNDWAFETTLDVEYAHVLAPGADILVVATPVAESEGVQGFPELMSALRYVLDNGLADVVSQSFGAAEDTFPSAQAVQDLRTAYVAAAAQGVTVLAAAGDTGATDLQLDDQTLFDRPVDSWPSSDPLVTSVGGTALHLDGNGDRTAPDTVWNDASGAGGGGLSAIFGRPAYQDPVRDVVGASRGTPDLAMSAGVDGGVLVYAGYDPASVGWGVVGGTSEATPLFAGVVAAAAQLAGHRLGPLNARLYRLRGEQDGIVDVTEGENSFGEVAGYQAGTGYDLASGLGTVRAPDLVRSLAAAS